jgi:putative Holliday junction resolvase
MRIMALDLGSKRIGVAVSDAEEILAHGQGVVLHRSRQADVEALTALAAQYEAARIVIGYPLLLSGLAGTQALAAKRLGKELARRSGLPVVYWDERLTSAEAHRLMRDAGISGRRQAERVDAAAAELILQSYLDWQRRDRAAGES